MQEPTQKFDPFHPEMPVIPGVTGGNPRTSFPRFSDSARHIAKAVGFFISALGLAALILLWFLGRADAPAVTEEVAPSRPEISLVAPAPASSRVAGPGQIATAAELSKEWASRRFTFVRPLTKEAVEAIVIRVPGIGLWAFSLTEPYGRCDLEYVTDLRNLRTKYGFRAIHPMVANPCTGTVYDPLQVGTVPGGAWVRGEIVQGSGLRPPISIDVRIRGNAVIAENIE